MLLTHLALFDDPPDLIESHFSYREDPHKVNQEEDEGVRTYAKKQPNASKGRFRLRHNGILPSVSEQSGCQAYGGSRYLLVQEEGTAPESAFP